MHVLINIFKIKIKINKQHAKEEGKQSKRGGNILLGLNQYLFRALKNWCLGVLKLAEMIEIYIYILKWIIFCSISKVVAPYIL